MKPRVWSLPTIVVAMALLFASCQSSRIEPRPFRFVDLRDGEVVEVHRAAIRSGVFHSECTVRIRGGNPPTVRARGIFDPGFREPVAFELAGLEGLDEALAYYRGRPSSAATTNGSVELDITWYRDGAVAFQETVIADLNRHSDSPPSMDFDEVAMESGVPVNKIEFIDTYPPLPGTPSRDQ